MLMTGSGPIDAERAFTQVTVDTVQPSQGSA
jgi:hypothetical protein